MTPTARTLQRLKKQGMVAGVVEKWNPHAKIRQDLFGVIDVVCLSDCITGIQATSGSNLAARVTKSKAEPRLAAWLRAGGKFECWGWRKLKKTNRWEVRRIGVVVVGHCLESFEITD